MARMTERELLATGLISKGQLRKLKVQAPAWQDPTRSETPSEDNLLYVCQREWPGLVVGQYEPFSSRRYRVDIALPSLCLAIEVDGWSEHHHKGRMDADRERDLFFLLRGWWTVRFMHRRVEQDLAGCMDRLRAVVALRIGHDS